MITSPVKAIRAYCLSCCLENANEVKLCPAEDCVLHPFRFGKNPYRAKKTEAQLKAAQLNFSKKSSENTGKETSQA